MLRWENLCVPELWFGSTPFYSILIPRAIFPKYEGSCMVYRPKWYREKKYHQIPIAYWYQKIWNPHYRYLNGIYIYIIPDQHSYQSVLLVSCWPVSVLGYCLFVSHEIMGVGWLYSNRWYWRQLALGWHWCSNALSFMVMLSLIGQRGEYWIS